MIVVFLSLLFGRAGFYRALTPTGVCGNRDARRPTELLSLSGHDRGENEHVSPLRAVTRNYLYFCRMKKIRCDVIFVASSRLINKNR